jgi:hypothetical protein
MRDDRASKSGVFQYQLEGIMKTTLRLALAVSSLATLAYSQTNDLAFSGGGVATWSVQTNTPQWNQELGVKYTRQGCSDAPAACIAFVGNVAHSENVKVTLHIPLNSLTTAAYALEYSQLSLNAPYLVEVSVDDFVSQFKVLPGQPAAIVEQVIKNLKSANHNLAFGATIYEDDLVSPYLQNAELPAAVRAQFQYVHLFLHYREDGPNFPGYVSKAKQLFPNARIIAGSYAYDRRAFLPCAPKGQTCTVEQDIDLFKQSLTIQVQEMKHGIVDHIEFYPGYFGTEDQWPSWTNARECDQTEIPACIANTKAMREAALSILAGKTAGATWGQLSPSGTAPLARYGQSATMDSANHRMIIFGGNSSTTPLNDTWILTNADGQHGQSTWIPVTAVAPPTGDYSAGMYDPDSNRIMLYGGSSGSDVWVLTNANGLGSSASEWVQLLPVGNLPDHITNYQRHVYDPDSNVMIVYDTSSGVFTLSHANGLGGTPVWTQLNVGANGPSPRAAFTAVYNPGNNRLIVFGGGANGVDLNDLWVLTNANGLGGTPEWIPLQTGTATVPAGRSGHTAVYDPASDSMSIFGGIGQPAETWTAANASGLMQPPVWTLTNSGTPVPDPRTDCTAVLDTSSQSMIVFGGYNTDFLNTVIVLSPVM